MLSIKHLQLLDKRYPAKRAFITGAGSGLGLAFSSYLAKSGWTIGINDVRQDRLDAASQAIRDAGGTSSSYEFDVSHFENFNEAVKDFAKKTGGIDIGINNAGIGCGGYLDELPIETFRRVIDINLMGVVNGCYSFVPVMKQQRSGHILNVASAAAFVSAPRMSAYNASKAGVVALSETLRGELAEHGVFVSVLMPTYVRTNIGNDSVGPSTDTQIAKLLVQQSQITPDQLVAEAMSKLAANELYLVMPSEAVFLWRFKRFMPAKFSRFISREAQRRVSSLDL